MKIIFNSLISFSGVSLVGTLCLLSTTKTANALTFVLDFNDSTEEITADIFDDEVTDFNVVDYGFAEAQFNTVTNSVLEKVESHFYDIPTQSNYSGATTSPIPDGEQLDIDFEIGDYSEIFTPSNGDLDFYFIQIGSEVSGSIFSLGQAGFKAARTSSGIEMISNRGKIVGSVFTDNINNLAGVGDILKTGNLDATTNAIAGTLSHEIGHTLSLEHAYKEQSETDDGVPPLMGTGALDLPNIDRISDRAFSFSAFGAASASSDDPHLNESQPILITEDLRFHPDEARDPFAPLPSIPANASTLNHVDQLVSAVGTRDVASVPFEFSPGMGLFVVASTWGITSLRKKS